MNQENERKGLSALPKMGAESTLESASAGNDYFRDRFSNQAKAYAVRTVGIDGMSQVTAGTKEAGRATEAGSETSVTSQEQDTQTNSTLITPAETASKPKVKKVVLKRQSKAENRSKRRQKPVGTGKMKQDRGVKEESEWTASLIGTDNSLPRIDPVSAVLETLELEAQPKSTDQTINTLPLDNNRAKTIKEMSPVPDRMLAKKLARETASKMVDNPIVAGADKAINESPVVLGERQPENPIQKESGKVKKKVATPGPKRKKPISNTGIPASVGQLVNQKEELTDDDIRNGLLAGKAKHDEFFDYLHDDQTGLESKTVKQKITGFFRRLLLTLLVLGLLIAAGGGAWYAQKKYNWVSRIKGQGTTGEISRVYAFTDLASAEKIKAEKHLPYLLVAPEREQLTLIAMAKDGSAHTVQLKESDLMEIPNGRDQVEECLVSNRPYVWYNNLLTCKNLISDTQMEANHQEFQRQGATDPLTDPELKKLVTRQVKDSQQITLSPDKKQYWVVEQINAMEIKVTAYPVNK